jgi:hypothetical protein
MRTWSKIPDGHDCPAFLPKRAFLALLLFLPLKTLAFLISPISVLRLVFSSLWRRIGLGARWELWTFPDPVALPSRFAANLTFFFCFTDGSTIASVAVVTVAVRGDGGEGFSLRIAGLRGVGAAKAGPFTVFAVFLAGAFCSACDEARGAEARATEELASDVFDFEDGEGFSGAETPLGEGLGFFFGSSGSSSTRRLDRLVFFSCSEGFDGVTSSSFSFSSSSDASSCDEAFSSAINPVQRPPSSSPRSQDHMGKLTLALVLIWRLWTLSHPPFMCPTMAGMAVSRLICICFGVCDSIPTFTDLYDGVTLRTRTVWLRSLRTCMSLYSGAYTRIRWHAPARPSGLCESDKQGWVVW